MKHLFKALFIILVLMLATVSASSTVPVKRSAFSHTRVVKHKPDVVKKTQALKQEMHVSSVAPSVVKGSVPKESGNMDVHWRRPAGLFPGFKVLKNGAEGGKYDMPLYFAKPYADYEFWGVAEGAGDDAIFSWEYQKIIHPEAGWEQPLLTYAGNPLTVNYFWGENNEVPTLRVETAEDGNMYFYQPGGYEMSGYSEHPVAGTFHVSYIESTPSALDFYEEEGTDLMVCSKTFCAGGRHADQYYIMTYYSGCNPYGDNETGWWFGKNGGRSNGMPVDGIAQAFEKPSHPYLLKQVVINTGVLEVTGPVEMNCRVYRLVDGIPGYDANHSVSLPENPGEIIAYGRASLTHETNDVTGGLIIFTLYEDENYSQVIQPTIDDAILICIDGYNEPDMANLKDFSACVSSDIYSDEGYGELAYIKYGQPADDGTFSGNYVWAGLNNFFTSGQMMTGMSIFITVDNPFLTYFYNKDGQHGHLENSEYTFPDEGGLMEKDLGDGIVTRSIEFLSYRPSANGAWTLTCNGVEVPDWLHIELTDGEENGEFDNSVHAEVIADPLPEGVTYRKAIVRFGFPGAYLDYKFMQGIKPDLEMDYDFVVDGIYYNKIDSVSAMVTFKNDNFNSYQGVVLIPNVVTYLGVDYAVTAIGNNAFKNCTGLNCVSIPCSISSIGENAFAGCGKLKNLVIDGNGDWQAGKLPVNVDNLVINKGVSSIHGLKTNPTTIYSYNSVPPECDENTFTGYDGTLHVPAASLASYFMAPYWCNFTNIVNNAVEPASVTISQDSLIIDRGNQMTLTASVMPVNATPNTVLWTSTNKNVATVQNGVVTAVAGGTCDIIASCVDKTAVCHVVVEDILPDTILLSENNLTLEVDSEHTLTATILPEDAYYTTVSWTTSNSSVATVNNGKVTAVGIGECDITVTCRDKHATCHVKVVDQIVYITLDQHQARLLPNHMLTLNPTMTPVSTTLQATSSDPSVAAVRVINGKVQIVGVSEGTTTITVGSTDGTAIPDTCQVTVYTEVGDLNSDGFVNMDDLTVMINYLLTSDATGINLTNADTNLKDGVTMDDLTALINYLLTNVWPWDVPVTETFTVNGVSFKMVVVEGGTFMMGATAEQGSDADDSEKPAHQVTLSSYSIGETEVTQALWLAVMGSNPSLFTFNLQHPVERVSWNDCKVFISKLNQMTGKSFRLPTEAEWEYAARGGKLSQGYKYAGSNTVGDVAWYYDNSDALGSSSPDYGMHTVATKAPNELGLYDMSGNVWEWCQDGYDYYASNAQTNPVGPYTGSGRVYRGGCWNSNSRYCRVSYRTSNSPSVAFYNLGLRLAL